jgi:hypothetical protein
VCESECPYHDQPVVRLTAPVGSRLGSLPYRLEVVRCSGVGRLRRSRIGVRCLSRLWGPDPRVRGANVGTCVDTVLVSSSGDGSRRECVVGPEGFARGRDACGPAWGRPTVVLVPSAWVIPLLSKNA